MNPAPPTSDWQPHDGSALCPLVGSTKIEAECNNGLTLECRAAQVRWETVKRYRLAAPVPEASETPLTDAAPVPTVTVVCEHGTTAFECPACLRQHALELEDQLSAAKRRVTQTDVIDHARKAAVIAIGKRDEQIAALETRLRSEQSARVLAEKERDEVREEQKRYSGWANWKEGLWLVTHGDNHDAEWMGNADALTTANAARDAAEARLRECEKELTNYRASVADLATTAREAIEDLDTLRAENERLRAAHSTLVDAITEWLNERSRKGYTVRDDNEPRVMDLIFHKPTDAALAQTKQV